MFNNSRGCLPRIIICVNPSFSMWSTVDIWLRCCLISPGLREASWTLHLYSPAAMFICFTSQHRNTSKLCSIRNYLSSRHGSTQESTVMSAYADRMHNSCKLLSQSHTQIAYVLPLDEHYMQFTDKPTTLSPRCPVHSAV